MNKILWASINKDFNSDYLIEESVKELNVLTHGKILKQCLPHAQEFFKVVVLFHKEVLYEMHVT